MSKLLASIVPASKAVGQFYSLFFGIPWIFTLGWVYLNGPSIFPSVWNDSWTQIVGVYMILDAFYIGMASGIAKKPDTFMSPKNSITFTVIFGTLGFTITWLTMYMIRYFVPYTSSQPTQMAFWATFLLQVVVIAASEEVIFRGLAIDLLNSKLPFIASALISSVMFAFYHYAAYGGFVAFMVVAFCLAMIWAYIRKWFGLGACIGSHAAYNLSIEGIIVFAPAASLILPAIL